MRRRATATLLLVLVALTAPRAWEGTAAGGEPPLDEELPEAAWDEPPAPSEPSEAEEPDWEKLHETWIVHVLFVDARTRAPIPGVRVRLHSEVPHPEASYGVPMGVAVSGPDGVARLRHDELDPVLVATYRSADIAIAEAPGYAVLGQQQKSWLGEWEMVPAQSVTLTVVDEVDRPVEGAVVSWVLGCGHTPDARQGRTDAAGRVTFHGVSPDRKHDPDIVVVKAGFEMEIVEDVPENDAPIRLRPGRVLEGRVVAADGRPIAGAAVGLRGHRHRGPWCRTDATGAFRLLGVPHDASDKTLAVETREYPISLAALTDLMLPVPNRRTPFLLTLPTAGAPTHVEAPTDGASDPEAPAEDLVDVDIALSWDGQDPAFGSLAPRAMASVVAIRREDDVRTSVGVTSDGRGRLRLQAGRHELLIRAWLQDLFDFDWPESGPMPVPNWLPCSSLRVPIEVVRGQTEPLRLRLPRPRTTIVQAGAAPHWSMAEALVPGQPTLWWTPDEDFTLLLPADVNLAIRLDNGWRSRPVQVQPTPDGTFALPLLRLPSLTLLAADGALLLEPKGVVDVLGLQGELADALEDPDPGDGFERRDGRLLVDGARVRVTSWRSLAREAEHVVEMPWVAVLEGPGPWQVRAPRGELVVHVERELAIEPPHVSLQVDGGVAERVHGPDVRVVGLADGPHDVVLRAEGHRARRLRFTLAEGGTLRWNARLRAR